MRCGSEGTRAVPLLVEAQTAAGFCSISTRTWRRMDRAGKVPRPVCLGSKTKRWGRQDLEQWIAAGCMPRREWKIRKRDKE